MCNCKGKGKSQVMNNVYNVDVVNYAKEIDTKVISVKNVSDYSDVDKVEVMGAYASLYPASSATPSIEEAINQIRIGIQLYDSKQQRR
jgi:hypothetical protein